MKKNPVIKYDPKKILQTGDWRFLSPKVDEEKCTACEICVKFCPEATINLETHNSQLTTQKKDKKNSYELRVTSYAKIDYDFCKGCGVCAVVCPVKAIIMQKLK